MEEQYIDDRFTAESVILTDKEVFTQIWTSPRRVFKFINDKHYDKYANVLLFFAGISRAFDRASLKDMGDDMSLGAIIGMSIVLGGLLGWIAFYIYSAAISGTGNWLKGKGDTRSILRVVAYAMLPASVGLLFIVPQIYFVGIEIFRSDGDIFMGGLLSNAIVGFSMLLQILLGIWSIVLAVVGISEVQQFSIGKAILNLLLPVLIFVGILVFIEAIVLVIGAL